MCQALPKRMTVDCTVSVTASSTNVASTSTRIKGLCAVHGIYDYEPMHSKRMLRLERLRTAAGDQLPRRFKEEIKRELQRLELVLQMIKAIETERDAIASAKASTHTNANKIHKLVKLRGIGAEFATVLVGEVFFRPFSNRHHIASYVGLTPSHFQSGSTSRDQGISKAGNPKARTTMVELVWMATLPTRQFFECLVPRACRRPQGPHSTHHHRSSGT